MCVCVCRVLLCVLLVESDLHRNVLVAVGVRRTWSTPYGGGIRNTGEFVMVVGGFSADPCPPSPQPIKGSIASGCDFGGPWYTVNVQKRIYRGRVFRFLRHSGARAEGGVLPTGNDVSAGRHRRPTADLHVHRGHRERTSTGLAGGLWAAHTWTITTTGEK